MDWLKFLGKAIKVFRTANHRTAGDHLRDAGKPLQAAQSYAQHLRDNPNDFDIWVQHGNCLKDFGDYKTAIKIITVQLI